MPRNDGATVRRERMAEIAKTVHAALFENKEAGFIPLQKTVAILSVNTGLVPSRVLSYLKLLNDSGQFEVDEAAGKISRKEGV